MPELKDVARVTRRGEDLPDLRDGGEMQTNAWLVHEAVKTEVSKADSGAQPYDYNGIPGMRWVGSVNAIMMDLWRPKLTNDPDDNKSQTFKRQLNSYLSATENLVCIARSAAKSTWWVRDEWNASAPQPRAAVSQRSARVPAVVTQPAEPAEQSDVKVSYKCLACEHVFPTEASRAAHYFTSHRSARSFIGEVLAGSAPLTVEALQERLLEMGYPGSVDITRRTLASMRLEGLVRSHGIVGEESETWGLAGVKPRADSAPEVKFAPPTTPQGEAKQEPAPQPAEPASPDKEAGYYCREPGCTVDTPFSAPYLRSRHEQTAHPDMTSRKYVCTFPGCNQRFYAGSGGPDDLAPLSIHAAREHDVRRNTPEGHALLQAARDIAAGKPTPPSKPLVVIADEPAVKEAKPKVPAIDDKYAPYVPPKGSAATPLKEGVDALDAVAALVEEVRKRRAEATENEALRQENATLREANENLRTRVSNMRKMVEDW